MIAMRTINADVLLKNTVNAGELHPGVPVVTVGTINLAPTVDAIPVRCGKCTGWEPEKRKIHKCDLCRMFGFGPNDYCSSGKRKDGGK